MSNYNKIVTKVKVTKVKPKTIRLQSNNRLYVHTVGSGKISFYNYSRHTQFIKKVYKGQKYYTLVPSGTYELTSTIGKELFRQLTTLMIDRKVGPGKYIDYFTRNGKGRNWFSISPSGKLIRSSPQGEWELDPNTKFGSQIFRLVLANA